MSTTTMVPTAPPRAEARYSIFPAGARDLARALVEGFAFTIALSLVGWLALLFSGPAAIAALVAIVGATCWGIARSARMIWQVTIGDRTTARIIARRPTFEPFYFGADLLRACATAGAASLVWASVIVTVFARHATWGGRPATSALRLLTHAEAMFAWQMFDLIPLIDAPSTLGWKAPDIVATPVSRVALMVFKLVVVALVLRLAAFVYEHSLKRPDPLTLDEASVGTSGKTLRPTRTPTVSSSVGARPSHPPAKP